MLDVDFGDLVEYIPDELEIDGRTNTNRANDQETDK